MKVLLLHTQYQQKGGEDGVFQQDFDLLIKTEKVNKLIFYNKSGSIGAAQFIFSLWNINSARNLRSAIRNHNPDIIHLHNWHFATGPIIIRTAKKMGIPLVITLHNYRLLCPSATFLHQGNIFTSSLQADFPWAAVRNRVYRNSAIQTFWLAFVVWFHKQIGTWKMVDRYLVLTDFARNLFVHSTLGVTAGSFIVKPNFVVDSPKSTQVRAESFLFIGRLSEEKGIETLVHAFRKNGLTLRIAGGGPLETLVLDASREVNTIHYLGTLDKLAIQRELSTCTALVFPSIWYEGMPMTILEAFAAGTPVVASNLGAMATMIQSGHNGLHFEAGNSTSLTDALLHWQALPETEKAIYRRNARTSYEAHHTPKENRKQLLAIYQQIIDEKKAS